MLECRTSANNILGIAMCALLSSVIPGDVAAQDPQTGTLSGVVLDAATGRPVTDARVALPAQAIETRTGANGGFELPGVPLGTHIVRVSGFGYAELSRLITVGQAEVVVELELEPAPFWLEGLAVDVDSIGTMTGTIVDAESREPLEGVVAWLPARGRGAPADTLGRFTIEDVAYGPHVIQVRRAGYGARMLPVTFGPDWDGIEIALEPDHLVLSALPALTRRLRGRRNAYPRIVTTHDTQRLTLSGADDVRDYVNKYTLTRVIPCTGSARSFWCIEFRGNPVEPAVCIDGWLEWGGLDLLQQLGPDQLHLLEVYESNGRIIRAYTHDYVETLARGAGGVQSAEPTPQREGVEGLGWSSARSGLQTSMLGPDADAL
jgi:hypothetical protein